MARIAGVIALVHRHLVLVGGVERNLAGLLVSLSDREHISKSQFHTLEESGLGRVSGDFLLQDGHAVLAALELGAVAESSDLGESLEARAGSVCGKKDRININYISALCNLLMKLQLNQP